MSRPHESTSVVKTKFDRHFLIAVLEDMLSFCQQPVPTQDQPALQSEGQGFSRQAVVACAKQRRQHLFRELGILDLLLKLTSGMYTRMAEPAHFSASSAPIAGPVAVAGAAFGSTNPDSTVQSVAFVIEKLDPEGDEVRRLFELAHRVLKVAMVGNDENRKSLAPHTKEILHQITGGIALAPSSKPSKWDAFELATETMMEVFDTHDETLDKVGP
jgi:hypothetical protein